MQEIIEQLKNASNATRLRIIRKESEMDAYGVPLGVLRRLAKEVRVEDALALWNTQNVDAMFLACLLFDYNAMSDEELDAFINEIPYLPMVDEVVKRVKKKERLQLLMNHDTLQNQRVYYLMMLEKIKKGTLDDVGALLIEIERDLPKENGNQMLIDLCLGFIGVNDPTLRPQVVALGEKLGVFKDYKVSKGCTSPYIPDWMASL